MYLLTFRSVVNKAFYFKVLLSGGRRENNADEVRPFVLHFIHTLVIDRFTHWPIDWRDIDTILITQWKRDSFKKSQHSSFSSAKGIMPGMPHDTRQPKDSLVTRALHCAQQSQWPRWPSCRTKPTVRGAQGCSAVHNHCPWGKVSSSLLQITPSQFFCHFIVILSGCYGHPDVPMPCSYALSLVHLTGIGFGSSQERTKGFHWKKK